MVAAMAIGAVNNAATTLASRRGEGMGARVRARVTARTTVRSAAAPLRVVAEDFPIPDTIKKTDNFEQGKELSSKFKVRRPGVRGGPK